MIKYASLLTVVFALLFIGCKAPSETPGQVLSPQVDDQLIGTWRSYDIETQTFDPLSAADIVITSTSFTIAGNTLPHNDCVVVVSGGNIGEKNSMTYFPLYYYSYDPTNDYLIIADTPAPTTATSGSAVYKRL